jgi:DNA-binding transcriptional regulator YiaG
MDEIEKLKFVLKKYNLSIENSSKEIGVTFRTMLNWLQKKHSPRGLSLSQLRKFIKKYENQNH